MTEVTVTKVIEDGGVYARQSFGDGRIVVEKADPRVTHDAPASVTEGTEVTVTFAVVDFDGAHRTDTGGVLLLEIENTAVPLPIIDGTATLVVELFASATVTQKPPYFCDARMDAFRIEVTP